MGGAKAAAGSGSKPGSQEQGSGMRVMGVSVGRRRRTCPGGEMAPRLGGWMAHRMRKRMGRWLSCRARRRSISQMRCRCAAGVGLLAEHEGAWKAGIDRGADTSRGWAG